MSDTDASQTTQPTSEPLTDAGPNCARATGSALSKRLDVMQVEARLCGRTEDADTLSDASTEIARLRGIIARNAMQRLDGSKFYITHEDIMASLVIAEEIRGEQNVKDKPRPSGRA